MFSVTTTEEKIAKEFNMVQNLSTRKSTKQQSLYYQVYEQYQLFF